MTTENELESIVGELNAAYQEANADWLRVGNGRSYSFQEVAAALIAEARAEAARWRQVAQQNQADTRCVVCRSASIDNCRLCSGEV